VVINLDPTDGVTPLEKVTPLSRARGLDIGFTTAIIPKVNLAVSAFSLRLASELIYIGDAGNSEPSGASQRSGIEVAAFYTPFPWLTIDADYAYSRARLDSPDGDRIPNALDNVFALGFTVPEQSTGLGRGFSGGLRLRHLGPAALTEDNRARSAGTTVVNGQLGYRLHPRLTARLTVLNLLDTDDNDITYFYPSRLAGEPAEGVDDFHLHPVEPRSLRLTLTGRF
jgi:outer membrane receptor protein involved in Fe transport